jgi:signal transduction histidine kinase
VNPFRSVGAKLSLALVALVAGALALVYVVVVPSLERSLINARLDQLAKAAPQVGREMPDPYVGFEDWPTFLEAASSSTNARVVVFYPLTDFGFQPARIATFRDSHGIDSTDVENDPIAERAANEFRTARGTVTRKGERFAEVAIPVAPRGWVLLLSSSLQDALDNVNLVKRRMLEVSVAALLASLVIGYGLAYIFARRIRRLEIAAERIAAGSFEEPVEDPSGDELGQLARAFDRMRLRLSQLERARREFIGNASHELRTPLFSLRGFIELLTDEELDEATRREFLETMREQVDRLQRLAEDLLDLTRLDAGRLRVDRRPVDLAEVATDLRDEFRAVAHASGHPLEVLASDAPALGDEERILRIGRALVENALRHTPPGTPVRLRSAATAFNTASLTVEDEGPGIPDEHARHVFERFYRVDGAHASGSGLGLAIAHELAEAMGGSLELQSGPGRTAFTLRLPAGPGDDVPEPEAVFTGSYG